MIRASTFGTSADFFYHRGRLTIGPELVQLLLDGFPLLEQERDCLLAQ